MQLHQKERHLVSD